MDFSLLERLAALLVLVVGGITAIVKIPDAILTMGANKKKYRSTANNPCWPCWMDTLRGFWSTNTRSEC
jgi:hypothetical protein